MSKVSAPTTSSLLPNAHAAQKCLVKDNLFLCLTQAHLATHCQFCPSTLNLSLSSNSRIISLLYRFLRERREGRY